jgi:hypothetical protein
MRELVLDRVRMVQIGHFEKLLQLIFWLPRLALEVTHNGCDILLIRAVRVLIIIVTTSSDSDPPEVSLLPLLPPLVPFLVPLPLTLNGVARLALGIVSPLPRIKTTLTASSPEVCRVAISSSSLVVFD